MYIARSPKCLIILHVIWIYDPFWVNFYNDVRYRLSFIFFACECPVFLAQVAEQMILFPLNSFCFLVKNHLALTALSRFSILFPFSLCLLLIPHSLDYCSFIERLEIRSCRFSSFFLSQNCSTCKFLQKPCWNFDWDCTESMNQFGENWHG